MQFYRRKLPTACIDFTSAEGKHIFAEALASEHMNCFFKLSAQFRTQDEPSYCGLTSLVIALNVLEIDPGRTWKGPWRWYHESMLDCCTPLDVIQKKGINMDQFTCLAHCNNLIVTAVPSSAIISLEQLRDVVKSATQRDDIVLIASYSRKVLQQTGDGHFSPVAGYHEGRDLVLMLDTARFKYPPHWISLQTLLKAMQTTDSDTGRSRGYFLLSRARDSNGLLLFKPSSALAVNLPGGTGTLTENLMQFVDGWKSWLEDSTSFEGAHDNQVLKSGIDALSGLLSHSNSHFSLFSLAVPGQAYGTDSVWCNLNCFSGYGQEEKELTCAFQVLKDQLEGLKTFQAVSTITASLRDEEKALFMRLLDLNLSESHTVCDLFGECEYSAAKKSAESCCKCSDNKEGEVPKQSLQGQRCMKRFAIKIEHIVSIFLLSWPHVFLLKKDRRKSPSTPNSNVETPAPSTNNGEILTQFILADLQESKGNVMKTEVEGISFKMEKALKFIMSSWVRLVPNVLIMSFPWNKTRMTERGTAPLGKTFLRGCPGTAAL